MWCAHIFVGSLSGQFETSAERRVCTPAIPLELALAHTCTHCARGSLCFTGKHKHTNTSLKYRSTNCRIIAGIAAGRCSEERRMKYVPATVSLASPNMPVVTSCHCSCSCCCQCNAVAVVSDDDDDDYQLDFLCREFPRPFCPPPSSPPTRPSSAQVLIVVCYDQLLCSCINFIHNRLPSMKNPT